MSDRHEKDLQKAVEDLLKAKRLKYMRVSNYRCFSCGQIQNRKATGHPDIEVYFPHFYIELKVGKNELTPEQKEVRELIEKSAYYIVVRDNIDELTKFIDQLLPRFIIQKCPGKPKRKLRRVLV